MMLDYRGLTDLEVRDLLLRNDSAAWDFVRNVIIEQEKKSVANNRKRWEWHEPLDAQLSELYLEMYGKKKLLKYRGSASSDFGSLIGWLRKYVKGYIEEPPLDPIDTTDTTEKEQQSGGRVSDGPSGSTYVSGDIQILKKEAWEIAQKIFREVWRENCIQAYVMLLKLRFGMSSAEIKTRLGISSEANVDQLFSRGVKKMKEKRDEYDR